MSSGLFRVVAVSAALSLTSGCMFTQWTDNAFFGVLEDPPTHHNREWLGIMILPLAVTGDIVTAPFQVVALMVTGDYGIYMGTDGRMSMNEDPAREMRVAGLDAEGKIVTEIALTPEQKLQLAARIQAGGES
jgi:hypothetical protein